MMDRTSCARYCNTHDFTCLLSFFLGRKSRSRQHAVLANLVSIAVPTYAKETCQCYCASTHAKVEQFLSIPCLLLQSPRRPREWREIAPHSHESRRSSVDKCPLHPKQEIALITSTDPMSRDDDVMCVMDLLIADFLLLNLPE